MIALLPNGCEPGTNAHPINRAALCPVSARSLAGNLAGAELSTSLPAPTAYSRCAENLERPQVHGQLGEARREAHGEARQHCCRHLRQPAPTATYRIPS